MASAVRRVDTIASSTARQGDGSGSPSLRLRTGTKPLGENPGERFVTFQDIDHQETLRADVLGKVSQVLEGLNRHTREVVEEALLVDSLGIAGKSNTNSGSSSKRGARTLLPRTLIEEAPQEQRESELERLITMVSAVVVGPTETPASRLVNR